MGGAVPLALLLTLALVLGAIAPEGLLPTARALQAGSAPLDSRVQRVINDAKLEARINVGVSIIDVQTGQVLAAIRERRPFIPASNLKLITAGAALAVLGADFHFQTEIHREPGPAGTRVIVRGDGDPALGDHDLLAEMGLSADQFLDRLAEPVIASFRADPGGGVREVILDDRIFDRDFYHATWPANQFQWWYCAQVWGINFHANVLEIYPDIQGIAPGQAPLLRKSPDAPWLEVRNNAQVVARGQSRTQTIDATRARADNRFTVMGDILVTPERPLRVTLHQPPMVLGRLLADRFARAGIAHPEGIIVRAAESEERFQFASPLIVVRTPIDRVLRRCNADSHNLFAEALLKRSGAAATGQPGSWANGTAVLRMKIAERLGTEMGQFTLADGCGLSEENQITPALMTAWLRSIAGDPALAGPFLASMPTQNESRLRDRFRDVRLRNEVRAKTGYIRGVLCLSGFVTDPQSGRRLAFAVFANNRPAELPGRAIRDMTDAIVGICDDFLARATAPPSQAPARRN